MFYTRIHFKLILVLFFSLGFSSKALAENEKKVVRAPSTYGSAMTNSTVITYTDDKYGVLTFPTAYNNSNIVNYVILGLEHSLDQSVSTAFDYNVSMSIYITDFGGGTSTVDKTLNISYDPSAATNYKDASVYYFNNARQVQVSITSIYNNLTSTTVSSLPVNVFLETGADIERYYSFNPSSTVSGINKVALNPTASSENTELEIYWNHFAGAEQYELEWVFVNNYLGEPGNLTQSDLSKLNYDFRHNSTRVKINHNFYRVSLFAESGYLLYRVRAIGRDVVSPFAILVSPWSTIDSGNVQSFNSSYSTSYYQKTSTHKSALNWQYSATYAEDGKKKEVINYFDGTLRNRQSVTKMNTASDVLVAETMYDHQGRPAVNVLPVPTGETYINYYDNFNRKNGTDAYTKAQFDIDSFDCEMSVPGAMNNSSGASKYYSSNNTNQKFEQAYLPIAEGYPFTRIEYTPDNTGRIRAQGGFGKSLQIGNGHETRYIYGLATQEELDRLFGSEAGVASRYKKNLAIDPNGQVSISVLDPQDRVVYTSLAGDTTAGIFQLKPAWTGMPDTVDLLMKNYVGKSELNRVDSGRHSIVLTNEFVVSAAGNYTFNYSVTPTDYTDACITPNSICFDCYYNLKISIKDDCGREKINTDREMVVGADTTSGGLPQLNTSCTSNSTITPLSSFVINLPVGKYTISKTLTVNEASIEYYVNQYLDSSKNVCVNTLQDFKSGQIQKMDTSGCDLSVCEECVAGLNIEDYNSAEEYEAAVALCREGCDYLSACDVLYETLLMDVSPGGQYAQYDLTQGGIKTTDFELSVLNDLNSLPKSLAGSGGPANWRKPKAGGYKNADGTLSKIYLSKVNNTFIPGILSSHPRYEFDADSEKVYFVYPDSLADVGDFVRYWQSSWAKSLVEYHPEYVYYQACKTNSVPGSSGLSSEQYDSIVYSKSTYASAVSAGLLNTSTGAFFAYDPFFLSGGLGASASADINAIKTNYKAKPGGGYYNMKEFAAITVRCGSFYGTNFPAVCDDFGTGSTTLKDKEWEILKALYFAEKRRIEERIITVYAITNNGYNGCIENKSFNPHVVSGFISNPMNTSTDPFFNSLQPCSQGTKDLYTDKIKRYRLESDILGANFIAEDATQQAVINYLNNSSGYNVFLETGLCPIATEIEAFLNILAIQDSIKAALPVLAHPEFSVKMYEGLKAPITSTDYQHYRWSPTFTNANLKMNGRFLDVSDVADTTYIHLEFPSGSAYTWANTGGAGNPYKIQGIRNLRKTNTGYKIDMIIKSASTGFILDTVTLSFATSYDLITCSFVEVCQPNQAVKDLATLLSVLSLAGDFSSTSWVDLEAVGYGPLITSATKAFYNDQTGFQWKKSNTNEFKLGNTNSPNPELIITFDAPPGGFNYSRIKMIKNIIPISTADYNAFKMLLKWDDDNNGLTPPVDLYLTGKITLDAIPFLVGDCNMPGDNTAGCNTDAHRLKLDLDYLLSDIFINRYTSRVPLENYYLTSASIPNYDIRNVGTSKYYTSLLASYFNTTNAHLLRKFNSTSQSVYAFVDAKNTSIELAEIKFELINALGTYNDMTYFSGVTDMLLDEVQQNAEFNEYTCRFRAFFYYGGAVYTEIIKGVIKGLPLQECSECGNDTTNIVVNGDFRLHSVPKEDWWPYGLYETSTFPYYVFSYYQYYLYNLPASTSGTGYVIKSNLIGSSSNWITWKYSQIKSRRQPGKDYYLEEIGCYISAPSTIWYQTVPVEYGKKYEMSFYVYLNNQHFQDTIGVSINSTNYKVVVDLKNPGWSRVSVQWVADVTYAHLAIQNIKHGTLHFDIDDISFKIAPAINCLQLAQTSGTYTSPIDTSDADPCKVHLYNVAIGNANYLHAQYVDSMRKDIRAKLYKKCYSAVENFTASFSRNEYHYTLYYYDQAGNLVRTIPPQGVNPISNRNKLKLVKKDRYEDKQTIFTEHSYITQYEYNSLNQLINQKMPDHNHTMDWDLNYSNGLPGGLVVNGVQFSNQTTGYLIGQVSNDGFIYATNDGGANWTKLTTIGVPDLKNIYMYSSTHGYAVGTDGTLIKTTDGGANWTTMLLGTSAKINDVYFSGDGTVGVIAGNGGFVRYTSNSGSSWGTGTGISGTVNINKISFESSSLGYATGVNSDGSGVVYKTTNSGATWSALTNWKANNIYATACIYDAVVYKGGRDGFLLRSEDAGNSWAYVNTGFTSDVAAISLFDPSNIMVILGNGSMYRSADAGVTWTLANVGGNVMRSVFCLPSGVAYATGNGGKVYKSTNYGQTWLSKTTGTSVNFKTAYFLDDNEGYIAGESTSFYFTFDGGYSWQAVETSGFGISGTIIKVYLESMDKVRFLLNDNSYYHIEDATSPSPNLLSPSGLSNITCFDFNPENKDKGYLGTIEGDVLYTNDAVNSIYTSTGPLFEGQVNTLNFSSNTGCVVGSENGDIFTVLFDASNVNDVSNTVIPLKLNSIAMYPASGVGAVVGDDGTIWGTEDGGSNWKLVASGKSEKLNGVGMYDVDKIYAVGDGGVILNTTSGPLGTWSPKTSSTTQALYSVKYVSGSATTAYVSSHNGKVLYTSNSGTTWTTLSTNLSTELYSLAVISGSNVVAVGKSGKIIRTTNTGATWANVTEVRPPVLNALYMIPSSSTGFAAGNGGKIYKTTDNGVTWQPKTTGTAQDLKGIAFFNADTGLVIGNTGVLLSTFNGGNTWNSITTGTSNNLNAIFLETSSKNGYIVGNSGTFIKTTNKGVTWSSPTNISSSVNLKSIVFNNNVGYTVGASGKIMKSQNAGATWTNLLSGANNWSYALTGVTRDLNQVYFRDYLTGYIVGNNGLIMKTIDGGASFSLQTSGTISNLNFVAFASPYHGIVIGNSGYAMTISDNTYRYSTYFWYDKLGRIVASQNSKQFLVDQYSYTLYDALNRIVETGQINQSAPFMLNYVGGQLDQELFLDWISSGSREQVTQTFYDLASVDLPSIVLEQKRLRGRVSYVTYERTDDVNASTFDYATYYSYDVHGNVESMVQELVRLLDYEQSYKRIDYTYDLVSGKVNEVSYQKGKPDQFFHRYEYDADNRITHTLTSADGILWDQDAKYFYYEHGPLGRTEIGGNQLQGVDYAYTLQGWLKGVNSNRLHSGDDMGKDNRASNANNYYGLHRHFSEDAFSYSLSYYGDVSNHNQRDYDAISTSYNYASGHSFVAEISGQNIDNKAYSPNLYNGNIRHMVTNLSAFDGAVAKTFQYDQLNRLVTAKTIGTLVSNTIIGGYNTAYDEVFSYDANGNILRTVRKDENGTTFDDFTYHYGNIAEGYDVNTNKLMYVEDAEGDGVATTDIDNQVTYNYYYDDIGNLIVDYQEFIDEIQWSASGKIMKIIGGYGKPIIEYEYDGMGNRVCKIVKPKREENLSEMAGEDKWVYTYYVRDASGNIMAVYEQSMRPIKEVEFYSIINLVEQPIYGSSRLGLFKPNTEMSYIRYILQDLDKESGIYQHREVRDFVASSLSTTSERVLGWKEYEMANHLGNVMAVVSNKKMYQSSTSFLPDVLMAQDYYAFGSPMPNRTYNSDKYRFGFNGKENDNEVKGTGNQQDYGMRIYDPRLGRFLSVDPLSKEFPWNSPFSFAEGSPIENIDLDGSEKYNYRLSMTSVGEIKITLTSQVDIVDKVIVGYKPVPFGEGAEQPIFETKINQRQEYSINGRNASLNAVLELQGKKAPAPIVQAGMNKIKADYAKNKGQFSENYNVAFGRFLFEQGFRGVSQSNFIKSASETWETVDNSTWKNGSTIYHLYESFVRQNDNTGYDKLMHFTASAFYAMKFGGSASYSLGFAKETFKDWLPGLVGFGEGWDSRDMRANQDGINYGNMVNGAVNNNTGEIDFCDDSCD